MSLNCIWYCFLWPFGVVSVTVSFPSTSYCAAWRNRNEMLRRKVQLSGSCQLPHLTCASLSSSPVLFCLHFKVIIECKEESATRGELKPWQLTCPRNYSSIWHCPEWRHQSLLLDCKERDRASLSKHPRVPYLCSSLPLPDNAAPEIYFWAYQISCQGSLHGLIL